MELSINNKRVCGNRNHKNKLKGLIGRDNPSHFEQKAQEAREWAEKFEFLDTNSNLYLDHKHQNFLISFLFGR